MNITIYNKRKGALKQTGAEKGKQTFYVQELAPMWAVVKKQNFVRNTVDVIMRNGIELKEVVVLSKTWAGFNDTTPFGGQLLPPLETEVLLMFPDNLIEEAVIVGSRIQTLGEAGAENETAFLDEGNEGIETIIDEYGYKFTKVTSSGKIEVTDINDSNFLISIDPAAKEIILKDWNENEIVLETAGVTLTDVNGNEVVLSSGGATITDSNGNEISTGATGITLNSLEVLL